MQLCHKGIMYTLESNKPSQKGIYGCLLSEVRLTNVLGLRNIMQAFVGLIMFQTSDDVSSGCHC